MSGNILTPILKKYVLTFNKRYKSPYYNFYVIFVFQVTSPLPNWLSFTPETRTFFGLPLSTDKSDALISVVAHGDEYSQLPAHAIFRVHVRRQPATTPCSTQPLVLTIFVDRKLSTIHPQQRAVAMDNLARFFGINIVSNFVLI